MLAHSPSAHAARLVEAPIRSRSAILQLMSAYGGTRSLSVSALLGGMRVLGVSENATRVALARLKAEGRVVGVDGERGQYRLGDAALPVHGEVAGWRAIEQRVCDWDGEGWVGVHTASLGRSDRTALAQRQRALRFVGFRALRKALFVRPRNLVGGVAAVAARLRELGLPDEALVVGIDELERSAAARARSLWDDERLDRRYAQLLAELAASTARIEQLELEQAAREAFVVGGGAIRALVFDPLLPAPIVDTARRSALVEAMSDYDQLGRSLWTELLG